jgi:glycosyltransferase involved in cell wall biosynthesis
MVRVTILFATLNGAHTLPPMLASLERLQSPAGGWKVVAVDNGSTDDSLAILEQSAAKLPMTVVSEPRRGKNIALNVGLALVEGEIVALTDDDVILPADWLVAIEGVAAQQPDYDIFGGAIVPVWEESPPDWLLRSVDKGFFALTDFPEGPIKSGSVWGPSMAVRTFVFRDHKFAEGIGPVGSKVYAMGSETEFTTRAERSGHRCWHFHAAPVGHIIRRNQLEPEWLLQRAYNLARGLRRIRHTNSDEGLLQLCGYPLRPVLGLIRAAYNVTTAACIVATARLFGDFENQFKASSRLRYCRGDFVERIAMIKSAQNLGPGSAAE